MRISFDQSKDEIAKLCHYFEVNRKSFLASGVKEAHVRQSLIDPFFETLGWDVRNSSRIAPQYREVVPEDSLDVEGHQKAPDYTFRIGTLPKFYAEAKKCGINISADPGPAYQLRRYAFSAKLALSILTDFEELGVYECSSRPRPSDKSSHSRIQYFRFDEYPDMWRDIWDIFSREAVWSGSFDQYITSKRKRGTSEVDTEFLKDIESWRESLARNIALRNPQISVLDLNAAVQRTIDRIIFLRMAEDRGLEPYAQILKLCEQPGIYRRFITGLCRKADERYNSGLFHFQKEPGISDAPDTITPRLIIDDKTLKPIIQSLYFEYGSPYHFGVLPVEILGTVYERFLGKVIRLTAGHQAKVEEKPEVRKAGGVYYTPSYIVDYIVKNTVGKQVEGKSPAQIAKGKDGQPIRILDMACGSGSFLLGAYQNLLDHCTKWYEANEPEKHSKAVFQDAKGTWRLTITERKRILTTHIFGVDIDHQAVEVTKLSLLLKALEGENDASLTQQMQLFQERALPNLSNNIKCGNSLIGADYFTGTLFPDPVALRRINPFDWKVEFPEAMRTGGFDCVIGNPPYIRIQNMKEYAPQEIEIYKQKYIAASSGNYDIYVIFVEKGLGLLNQRGCVGLILPSKFFSTDYGLALRRLLIDQKALTEIVDFGHSQVFSNATTYTCLLFLSGMPSKQVSYAKIVPSPQLSNTQIIFQSIETSDFSDEPWLFATELENSLVEKLKQGSVALGELPARIGRGSSSGADDVFILRQEGESLINRQGERVQVEPEILRIPIYATDFRRYLFQPQSGEVIIFPYDVIPNGYKIKPEADFRNHFPKTYQYLISRRKELESRKQFQLWYGFSAPRNLDVHDAAQILVPLLADRGLYCRLPAESSKFCLMASGGFSITVNSENRLSPNYVIGLLNSRLLYWRLHSISNVFRGGWITCTKQYVETLPIHCVNFSNAFEKSQYEKIVEFVEQMLDLHKRKARLQNAAEQEQVQRIINSTDRQIDALVYELYGLTQEEIEIVEASRSSG